MKTCKSIVLALSILGAAFAIAEETNVDAIDLNPAFDGMDSDVDGFVSKAEWFAAGMAPMSYDGLFKRILDADQSGTIDREEFTAAQPRFKVDMDGDGKASSHEFVAANNAAGERMKAEGGMPPPMPN